MEETKRKKWTLPMLGLGFGAALLISVLSEDSEPEPQRATGRRARMETGLAPAPQAPTSGWTIGHAIWNAEVDESARHEQVRPPDPRAEDFRGMALGVAR